MVSTMLNIFPYNFIYFQNLFLNSKSKITNIFLKFPKNAANLEIVINRHNVTTFP